MTARAQSRAYDAPIILAWLAAAICLAALPFVFASGSAITIMNQMAITVVFALSYNMLLGQAGMLSFGHAVYMGVGGFMCIHAMNYMQGASLTAPLPVLPLIAGLFSMGVATVVGSFSTRRAGTVFAMISLGVVELVASAAIIVAVFFQGGGAGGDRTLSAPVFGVDFAQQIEIYYLVMGWTVASVALMYLFTRTPVGRMANAVRDNPERAEFIGYSASLVRLISFSAAGFFAGIAGGLFAICYEIITVENLDVQASGTILMIAFLGGVGYFFGPILGAILFTALQTVLSLETELWRLYIGALFVGTVMFFPGGLAGVLMMHVPVIRAGGARRLIAPYVRTLAPAAVSLLGCAAFAEILFHTRRSTSGEMSLFWVGFDGFSAAPWLISGGAAIAGFLLARREARGLVAAWRAARPANSREQASSRP